MTGDPTQSQPQMLQHVHRQAGNASSLKSDVWMTSATFIVFTGAAALLASFFGRAKKGRAAELRLASTQPSATHMTEMTLHHSLSFGPHDPSAEVPLDATVRNDDDEDNALGRRFLMRHMQVLALLRHEPARAADAEPTPEEIAMMREYVTLVDKALNQLIDRVRSSLKAPASADAASTESLWASDFELALTSLDQATFNFLSAVATVPNDRHVKGLPANTDVVENLQSFRDNLVLGARIVVEPKTLAAVVEDLAKEQSVCLPWSVEFDVKPFANRLPEWSSASVQEYFTRSLQSGDLGLPVTLRFQGTSKLYFNPDGKISRIEMVDTSTMYRPTPDVPHVSMAHSIVQAALERAPWITL
eukprot:TRINITY_DN26276_c0_g1_i3.p1 TRINITY_DN26276_c0_g1~~TRINITY_DN26276_c0_g1_i3.p1  ORF type:complete len:412 (+),score=41.16 TRINITY_DN26276_c0_g1_i3:157-1236(+)